MTIKTIPLIGFNALTVLTLLSASTLLAGCGGADATSKESNEELVISVPVEAGALHIGDISSNYTTTAVLEAKEEAYVVARASGIIEHIYVAGSITGLIRSTNASTLLSCNALNVRVAA